MTARIVPARSVTPRIVTVLGVLALLAGIHPARAGGGRGRGTGTGRGCRSSSTSWRPRAAVAG